MEKKTMGSFMAALRKANGLTQQQVADKLNVSNKTISKWECDEGYPEITMLPAIAEIYSVTVDELLRGEKITKEYYDAPKNDGKAKKLMMHLFHIVCHFSCSRLFCTAYFPFICCRNFRCNYFLDIGGCCSNNRNYRLYELQKVT